MRIPRPAMTGLLAALLVLLLEPVSSLGAEPADAEIQHLLQFVGESGCIFVRNGDEYRSPEARDHMEMKYGYGKRRIKTAEAFIEHIATRSSMTRKPYMVRCDGQELPSAQWLTEALQRYREQASSSDTRAFESGLPVAGYTRGMMSGIDLS